MQIKVVSWNIWGGRYLPTIIEFLKKSDTDVIGLQEVFQESDGKKNTAQIISKVLGCAYVYATAMPWEENGKIREIGNAIVTKHRIVGSTTHILSSIKRRVAVQADIAVGDTTIHVVSTHLVHTHQKPSSVQTQQAKKLVRAVPKEKTIVMGDFNATPESETIRVMEGKMQNLNSQNAPTWSMYTKGCEVCRVRTVSVTLDYIFVSRDLKGFSFKPQKSDGSDHLPVSAVIEV
jgi:endonuclease/exonuclease/phosphatase family metal-dependent hydrolase